jgi:hypothetical protein
MDLQGKFARRRDDQGTRRGRPPEPLDVTQKVFYNGQPVSDRFAGSGLRRNKKVAIDSLVCKHGDLNGGRLTVAALG